MYSVQNIQQERNLRCKKKVERRRESDGPRAVDCNEPRGDCEGYDIPASVHVVKGMERAKFCQLGEQNRTTDDVGGTDQRGMNKQLLKRGVRGPQLT